jgi:hypothetical protein
VFTEAKHGVAASEDNKLYRWDGTTWTYEDNHP